MHPKPHFVYENKTIFVYFLTISGIIHLIIIFSTSSFNHYLLPEIRLNDNESENNNYFIEIDLESGNQEEENIEDEELAEEQDEEYDEEEIAKDKEQLFVDTSENVVDEETQTDTDKIGEKGSVAKDMYTEENNVNDKPRLVSDVDTSGDVPDDFAATATQESGLPVEVSFSEAVREDADDVQESVEEETIDSMAEVSNSEELPQNSKVGVLEETKDNTVVQDVKTMKEETKEEAISDYEAEQVVNVEKIVSETRESDIAVLDAELLKKNEIESDMIEEKKEMQIDAVEEYTETAYIPEYMRKEVLEDRSEGIADKTQNRLTAPETRPYNVPAGDNAPFFEDKISNAPVTGAESFNVKKHEYAPYYKHIRDKIRLYWLLQYGTDPSINQVTRDYKPVVVTFKVLSSGKIVDVIILDSAGNELLASKIQISIQNTTLNKFPEYIDENHIDVKFSYFFF